MTMILKSETTKIRITMTTNAGARRDGSSIFHDIRGSRSTHNGGNVIIAYVPTADLVRASEMLDSDNSVRGYEVSP